MSFIDSFFDTNSSCKLEIYTVTQTKTNGLLSAKTYTLAKTVSQCLFWTGSMGRSIVGEKYKADVSGVIVLRPEDCATSYFNSINKLTIYDSSNTVIGNFTALYFDNIGNQDAVLQIPVKEFVN